MMSVVLRRRSLTAIETLLRHRHYSIAAAASAADATVASRNGGPGGELKPFSSSGVLQRESSYGFQVRSFHAKSGPLGYRASEVLRAEFAVDVDSYDEASKGSGNDDGLVIAKLGISQEIVSALAKRGISKLFPIQVTFFFF